MAMGSARRGVGEVCGVYAHTVESSEIPYNTQRVVPYVARERKAVNKAVKKSRRRVTVGVAREP